MTSSIYKSLAKRSLSLYGGGGAACPLDRRRLISPIPLFSRLSTSAASVEGSKSDQSQEFDLGRWAMRIAFFHGAVAFGMATWQVFVLQEKEEILEYRQKRLEMPLVDLNAVSTVKNRQSLSFRWVVCKGIYDENRSIFVGPRPRCVSTATENVAPNAKENGYYVITPFMPVPGDPESVQFPVLVNRGWVPCSWRDEFLEANKNAEKPRQTSPSSLQVKTSPRWRVWPIKFEKHKEEAPPKGIVRQFVGLIGESEAITPPPKGIVRHFVGLIRGSEEPITPVNDPSSDQWVYIDVPAIADACGLPRNLFYINEVCYDDGNPAGNHYPAPNDLHTLATFGVMTEYHRHLIIKWYVNSIWSTAAGCWALKKRLK